MGESRLRVDLGPRSYDIVVGANLIDKCGELVAQVFSPPRQVVVITNPKIGGLYGEQTKESLAATGFEVFLIEVPAGERSKSLPMASRLFGRLLEIGADRETVILALGGGVVGDLAGFLAATFMRGIALVQVPTSLLAQVDSSVGGKTAVNHPRAKNIIGVFHQPRLVVVDPTVLNTLPPREFRAGLSEIVKYALIAGDPLLASVRALLPFSGQMEAMTPIIVSCCEYKANVVAEDERDTGRRAWLNYGHTIGHAIEAVAGYRRYNHGEAISIGMLGAAQIARSKGLLDDKAVVVHENMLSAGGLPIRAANIDKSVVYEHLKLDKKRSGGRDRLVLLEALGCPGVYDVDPGLIKNALAKICAK